MRIRFSHRRTTRSNRRGIAAVELAVCLPVIVLLVFGSIEASSFIFLKQSLNVSAYEGIREAIRVGSNNAAAVIGTPVAISIAQQLQAPVEPFVLAVIFGANMSFATPIGYHTNMLIMSAGGYKFSDFLRVGIPLTIIMWVGFSLVLPMLYEL